MKEKFLAYPGSPTSVYLAWCVITKVPFINQCIADHTNVVFFSHELQFLRLIGIDCPKIVVKNGLAMNLPQDIIPIKDTLIMSVRNKIIFSVSQRVPVASMNSGGFCRKMDLLIVI